MQFKTPLTSQDEYVCRLNIKKDGIKYVFLQDIFRLPDEKLCVRAQVDTVCITNGKLQTTTPLDHLLDPYFMKEE
jgi:acyl-CoA thioester hydrolase